MIVGIGCDMIEIERIRAAMGRNPHFAERIYTEAERAYIAKKRPETAAGLFAAKEAAVKALGTGFRGFMPDSVEILPDELGKPCCRLTGKALSAAQERSIAVIHISISHTKDNACAFAVAERGGEYGGVL